MSLPDALRRRTLPVALGALGLVALVSAGAGAATSWPPPTRLGDSGRAALAPRPALAVDAAGEAVAVWERRDHGSSMIQAASRPPGGQWSAPIPISRKGQEVAEPEIAVDPAGKAVVVWQRSSRGDSIVQSASRSPGGRWSAPVDISAKGGRAMVSRVAVGAGGDAVAVWQRFDGRNAAVQAASLRPGRRWSAPVDLSAKGREALGPEVAVDAAGAAVAVWRRVDGFRVVVQSAARRPGADWSPPHDVSSPGAEAFVPQVAIGAGGEAVAVWESSDGESRAILGASRTPGGTWSRPKELSAKGRGGSVPQVAVDSGGEAVAVWEAKRRNSTIESAARPSAGAWSAPAVLSTNGGRALKPQVALDDAGEATAIWQRFTGRGFAVESAARPPGAAWSAPARLSAPGKYSVEPRVGLAAGGEAVAVWGDFVGSRLVIEGAARP